MRTGLIVAILLTVTCAPLSATEHRSREVTLEFQREHPCPLDGENQWRLSPVLVHPVLFNAFKRLASGASASEKADLFAGTASRFYRLVI
jgi:hypothetical protein